GRRYGTPPRLPWRRAVAEPPERDPEPEAWADPPVGLALGPSEVHVWQFELEGPAGRFATLQELLSTEESERARRLKSPEALQGFTRARGIMRRILAGYTGIPPGEIRFLYGPWGKPRLEANPELAVLRFNLSHSGGRGLLAV